MGGELLVLVLHRHHHRRPRLGRRLLHRRDPGRADRQLRRLPRAEAGAGLQHSADGRRAAVAPARPLSRERPMMILSGDPPRGRAADRGARRRDPRASRLAPFLFPGAKALNVAAQICVYALLGASYDLLLGYAGIVSFAHVMFFGVGSYGVGLALYGLGPSWGALALGLAAALVVSLALALAIGAVLAARAGDLLRHGDAGGRLRLQRAGFAALLADRRRRRALVSGSRRAATGFQADRRRISRRRDQRAGARLLSRLRRRGARLSRAAARRQFAVRPGAAGDPRERLPRRSARLPHRLSPHVCDRGRGGGSDRRGGAQRHLAALRRPRHGAQLLDPDRRAGHRRRRRHGLAVRRDSRRRDLRGGGELSAEPDGPALAGRGRRAACRFCPRSSIPTAGCLWLGLAFVLAIYFAPQGIVGRLRPSAREEE